MVSHFNPFEWVRRNMPRDQVQLEILIRKILKVAFWVALLLPLILVQVYYLIVSLVH